MAYEVEDKAHSWVLTYRTLKSGEVIPNKGCRSVMVTQGAYVIDNISSGWFIVGNSRTVSADIDRHLQQLQQGRHPNRMFQAQYNREADLRFIEIPANDAKTAKRIEAKIRASNTTDYCLKN